MRYILYCSHQRCRATAREREIVASVEARERRLDRDRAGKRGNVLPKKAQRNRDDYPHVKQLDVWKIVSSPLRLSEMPPLFGAGGISMWNAVCDKIMPPYGRV